MEAEKLRRTNMQMSLNQNVMDKANDAGSKFSNSAKKLPSVLSKQKSPFKEVAFHQINIIHERTGSGFYNSSAASTVNGGMSPLKLMSMTMPKGFVSPNNSRKAPHEMNKTEIKEVVKSYFDKSPPRPANYQQVNTTLVPPTSAGAYSMTNEFVIQVGAFTASPQKI